MARDGFTGKINALCDHEDRPLSFHLTGGEATDCTAFDPLMDIALTKPKMFLADKRYDSDHICQSLLMTNVLPVVLQKLTAGSLCLMIVRLTKSATKLSVCSINSSSSAASPQGTTKSNNHSWPSYVSYLQKCTKITAKLLDDLQYRMKYAALDFGVRPFMAWGTVREEHAPATT